MRRERGYALILAVGYCVILAAVMLVAGRMFQTSMHMQRQANAAAVLLRQYDGFVRSLRADVANAYDIEVGDERTVTLRHADETVITWQVADEAGTLTRTASHPRQGQPVVRTVAAGFGVPRFSRDGVMLVARWDRGERGRAMDESFISQLLFAGRGVRR